MELEIIDLIYKITAFIIGTLVGSFITLAIYRIPRKEDIWVKRSYCPNCKHRLGFFDCFPILSYISTVGRCKYCMKHISVRYIIIEFLNGFVFVFSFMFFGFSWQLIVFLIIYLYIFISLGTNVMRKKMEKDNNITKKDITKDKKKGFINIEIIIAVIIFIVYFITIIYASRNYTLVLQEYKKKSEALNICLNTVSEYKFYEISDLENSKTQIDIENNIYDLDVNVYNYIKDGYIEIENMKQVDVTVRYLLNEETEEITISFIREVENEI